MQKKRGKKTKTNLFGDEGEMAEIAHIKTDRSDSRYNTWATGIVKMLKKYMREYNSIHCSMLVCRIQMAMSLRRHSRCTCLGGDDLRDIGHQLIEAPKHGTCKL